MLPQLSRIAAPPLILVVALVIYRIAFVEPEPPAVELADNEPNRVALQYDWVDIVSSDQVYQVLDRLKPPKNVYESNTLIHALRLWGRDARFDDPAIPDGELMWRFFTDDEVFRQVAGQDAPPLYERTPEGLFVRPWIDNDPNRGTGSHHINDFLATMGETMTPLDTPLKLRDGSPATIRDLLETALANYTPDQREYEWTAINYARYVFPTWSFKNRYGETIDAQHFVDRLTTEPIEHGVCNATHRLEALAVLLRIDDEQQQLSSGTRQQIINRLRDVSLRLYHSQTEAGYWHRDWVSGPKASEPADSSQYDRILATGHHLEWMALAPHEALPPRESIRRATQWLVQAILSEEESHIRAKYGPYSHAGRAMCLFRLKDPYRAWKDGDDKRKRRKEDVPPAA